MMKLQLAILIAALAMADNHEEVVISDGSGDVVGDTNTGSEGNSEPAEPAAEPEDEPVVEPEAGTDVDYPEDPDDPFLEYNDPVRKEAENKLVADGEGWPSGVAEFEDDWDYFAPSVWNNWRGRPKFYGAPEYFWN